MGLINILGNEVVGGILVSVTAVLKDSRGSAEGGGASVLERKRITRIKSNRPRKTFAAVNLPLVEVDRMFELRLHPSKGLGFCTFTTRSDLRWGNVKRILECVDTMPWTL